MGPLGLRDVFMCHISGGFLPAGKCHLYRAVTDHKESVREASLCKKLRDIHVLQEVLSVAQQRTWLKYSRHREDDDLVDLIDAPDIICKCLELCAFCCLEACVCYQGTWLNAACIYVPFRDHTSSHYVLGSGGTECCSFVAFPFPSSPLQWLLHDLQPPGTPLAPPSSPDPQPSSIGTGLPAILVLFLPP